MLERKFIQRERERKRERERERERACLFVSASI